MERPGHVLGLVVALRWAAEMKLGGFSEVRWERYLQNWGLISGCLGVAGLCLGVTGGYTSLSWHVLGEFDRSSMLLEPGDVAISMFIAPASLI